MKFKYAIAVLLAVTAGSPAFSTEYTAEETSPAAVARLTWIKIRGYVASIDAQNRSLEISDLDGNITNVSVNANVQILRSYRVVEFEALKPKDKVELRYVRGGM